MTAQPMAAFRTTTLPAPPLDKPDTVHMLKANSPVHLTHMGVARSGIDCIFPWVGRPRDLCRACVATGKYK